MLALRDHYQQSIWLGDELVHSAPQKEGSISVLDLEKQVSVHIQGPYDALHFAIPHAAVEDYTHCHNFPHFRVLEPHYGRMDRTVEHLGLAVLPLFDHAEPPAQIFFDQLLSALCAHLVRWYGSRDGMKLRTSGGLTPWQVRRATEKMREHLNGDVSLAEVAAECEMSVSHFVRSFKQTVGESPVRWLVSRRIEMSKQMLVRSTMTLEEIGHRCGYADQACFTRAFRQRTGTTPGEWRRSRIQLSGFGVSRIRRSYKVLSDEGSTAQ